jgi:nitroimidazol reductase NimA-like FMN-containing flavoprotein (pyridoxamine 5'-phosphate oxidase superfamily)
MSRMPLEGDDLREFLEDVRLCHWATVGPDGAPSVRPLWYLYTDRAFWFTTRLEARRTGSDVTQGSSVAVSIASEDRPYRAVVAYGRPEVWEEDRDAWLERIATRYGEREGRQWLAGALKEPDRVVLRLLPQSVIAWDYGKRDYGRMQEGRSLRVELP